MPHRLDARAPGFEAAFEAFLAVKRDAETDVARVVDDILADLRERGDAALIDFTERFDRIRLTPETLRISESEIAAAASLLQGQADEATPVVLVRGLPPAIPERPAASLIRPKAEDLFR